jgi:hypothetical protein
MVTNRKLQCEVEIFHEGLVEMKNPRQSMLGKQIESEVKCLRSQDLEISRSQGYFKIIASRRNLKGHIPQHFVHPYIIHHVTLSLAKTR